MDNTTAIAALIGLAMPVIITIVKQAGFNRWWNLAISIVACAIAGTVTVWARGELNWSNWVAAVVAVIVAAQAIYGAFWKDAEVQSTLNNATSFIKE